MIHLLHPLLAEESVVTDIAFGPQLLKMVMLIALLVVVAMATMRSLRGMQRRRFFYGNGNYDIKILERRPLSPKSVLYLIEVQGRTLLISDSSGGVQMISELAQIASEVEPMATPPKRSFAQVLKERLHLSRQ